MRKIVLSENRFKKTMPGWDESRKGDWRVDAGAKGTVVHAEGKETVSIGGPGVHTRNGDAIELHFQVLEKGKGQLRFGFSGGMESAVVTLNFEKGEVLFGTSDWTCPQPAGRAKFKLKKKDSHVLQIEKSAGKGGR